MVITKVGMGDLTNWPKMDLSCSITNQILYVSPLKCTRVSAEVPVLENPLSYDANLSMN